MANPSYSLDNITFHTLLGAYQFGGRPRSKEESDIIIETDSGVVFSYLEFKRNVWEIRFRCSPTELDTHDDLDELVGGNTPFYFSMSGVGAADSEYVRKEPGFDPQELDTPGNKNSVFDYVLRMKTELI